MNLSIIDLVMFYKSRHQLALQYLSSMFIKNSDLCPGNLRNTETDLRLPIKKLVNGQKFFSFRGAKHWNSLSIDGFSQGCKG